MFQVHAICQECNKRINVQEMDYVAEFGGGLSIRRAWHIPCLPVSLVRSGTVNADGRQLFRWAAWQLKQIEESNSMLVQRTDALAKEVERLMKAQGASDQDIKDFRAEFSVYDNEEGP